MNSEMYRKLNPTKLFFMCAIPAVITSVFGALYSVVDGFFVGKFLGENALAAINLIMPIIMIVEALSNMIAPGATNEAIEFATEYLKIFAIFGPIIPIYFATDNYLRVCVKQELSMIVNIGTQVLNVILDFILIVVLHQGIQAAAIFSGILTLIMAKTLKIRCEKDSK